MTHSSEYIKELLKKHIEGRASAAEIETLLAVLDLYDKAEIAQMIDEIDPEINLDNFRNSRLKAPSYRKLKARINRTSSSKIKTPVRWIPVHAALNLGAVILAITLAWFLNRPSKLQYSCGVFPGDSEIPTRPYTCRILLNSGCSILIDSAYKGSVAKQGNTEIIKLQSGVLLYKRLSPASANDREKWMFNTITTSGGDQYQVILPDGTQVRLNAASSIRFPVEFSSTERAVVLAGEAFFDVIPDKSAPFSVQVGNAEIKALGTSFNVNAYSENTVTTLVSGSLQLTNYGDSMRLKPGQEAIIRHEPAKNRDSMIIIDHADTAKTLSWKKATRVYKETPLKDFITDIGRWYDLEIVNINDVPDGLISIRLCYAMPLNEILKMLRVNGIYFIQDGRKIIFYPSPPTPGPSTSAGYPDHAHGNFSYPGNADHSPG